MSLWRSVWPCSNTTCKACSTMKTSKRDVRKARPAASPAAGPRPISGAAPRLRWQPYALGLAALLAVVWAYAPAAHGPFLFDDNALPFALPNVSAPLRIWVNSVRPLLMFTYWANARISGDDTYSYHVVNVILHLLAGGL